MEIQVPGQLRLSPTLLQAWLEAGCPAKWKFEREWEPVGGNRFLEVGTLVHSMMDGSVLPDKVDDEDARKFYDKLKDALSFAGLKILYTEVKLEWELMPSITWVIKVDAIAETYSGELVVLDYKTNWGKGWKKVGPYVPQAFAFQSPGYLVPPPMEVWDKTPWPKSVVYIVAPMWSAAQLLKYDRNEADTTNLYHAITLAATSMKLNLYPKVPGKLCLDCSFKELCFDIDGWENIYRKRD